MVGKFRLAGVLRLRKLEEDQARMRLVGADADLGETLDRVGGLAAYVDASPEHASSSASLAAIAASRAASGSLFAVLEAEARLRVQEVDAARTELQRARTASLGLEKLEERHEDATTRAEGRAEQATLDEVASTSWRPTGRTAAP
jgi:flagellar protein FliJ